MYILRSTTSERVDQMGIKKFGDAFSRAYVPVKSLCDVVRGKGIALDMHLFLYKSIKALGHMTLTDSSGVPTAGINNLLNLIPKLKKAGASKIIAVFDNPAGGSPLKAKECAKRHAAGEVCRERARAEADEDIKAQLETRAWTIDASVITDAQHLLTLLGVDSHVAPAGWEAEHYAAHLAATGVVDMVLSDDSDTVMFGAPKTLMPRTIRVGKTTCKYVLVDLAFLLNAYGISIDELRRICVALGCDFAEKTTGVGPVTALTRGKNLTPTVEQKEALIHIAATPTGRVEILSGKVNHVEAAIWLSESKGFNYARVAKKLGVVITTTPAPVVLAPPIDPQAGNLAVL